MRFPAPFGRFYGVFCPNGHQIEAKCISPHCSVEKLARQQYRSGKNLAEYNRTVTKLRQRMRFLAPFGHLYGVFRPNGHQIMANNAFSCTVRPLLWRFPPERLTSATLLWQKCGRYPLRMRNLPRFYGYTVLSMTDSSRSSASSLHTSISPQALTDKEKEKEMPWRTSPLCLLFEEAGLEDNAAAVNLAVNLFWILGQADALDLCSTLDDH